jgi:hypothetical protein
MSELTADHPLCQLPFHISELGRVRETPSAPKLPDLPVELWPTICESLSVRDLSRVQSVSWALRYAVKVELKKRAKRGLNNLEENGKPNLYCKISKFIKCTSPTYGTSEARVDVPYRYDQMSDGKGLRFGNCHRISVKTNHNLRDWIFGWDSEGPIENWGAVRRHCGTEHNRIERMYLSFPDPVDDDYTVFCVYTRYFRPRGRGVWEDWDHKPTDEELTLLWLHEMGLQAVFCIETHKIDGMMNPWCDRPWGEKRWVVEFPLPLLKELEFDFVITGFQAEMCNQCELFERNDFIADFVTEFTVYPRTGTWPFDDEEDVERTKCYAKEQGVLRMRELCECGGLKLDQKWEYFSSFLYYRGFPWLKGDSEL